MIFYGKAIVQTLQVMWLSLGLDNSSDDKNLKNYTTLLSLSNNFRQMHPPSSLDKFSGNLDYTRES